MIDEKFNCEYKYEITITHSKKLVTLLFPNRYLVKHT